MALARSAAARGFAARREGARAFRRDRTDLQLESACETRIGGGEAGPFIEAAPDCRPVAADDLLRFAERAVGHADLRDGLALRCQTLARLHPAFGDELL